jgi:alpha-beta hydrolase superfamily lysophospholipase
VTLTLPSPVLEFDEPAGLSPRGTLIVLAGRGEAAGVYERFGRRISVDAWRVRVLAHSTDAAATSASIDAILADENSPAPRVLVGSDAGAALAADYAAGHPDAADGLILVGLPTRTDQTAVGGDPELRSACPVHRRTLDDSELVEPGALASELPSAFAAPDPATIKQPTLAIHGDADAVVALGEALDYYRQLPAADVVTVRGGRHDVLNDLSHRSVAATIVIFIERLKAGATIVERP